MDDGVEPSERFGLVGHVRGLIEVGEVAEDGTVPTGPIGCGRAARWLAPMHDDIVSPRCQLGRRVQPEATG